MIISLGGKRVSRRKGQYAHRYEAQGDSQEEAKQVIVDIKHVSIRK
jgi:hypothetical protein